MAVRTLLVVDDDPTLGTIVQKALPICRVITAGNGSGLFEALRQYRPAVIALSISEATELSVAGVGDEAETVASLADDGLSVLSRILAEAPSTKIIALAPRGKRLLAVRAVARGAHDVCGTPVDTHELASVVERAFYRSELEMEGRRLGTGDAPPTLRVLRDEAERRALIDALARSGGNLSATARLLGISRPTLYSLLRQHGIRAD
jgi:DNA-binding NtrC family response regulator